MKLVEFCLVLLFAVFSSAQADSCDPYYEIRQECEEKLGLSDEDLEKLQEKPLDAGDYLCCYFEKKGVAYDEKFSMEKVAEYAAKTPAIAAVLAESTKCHKEVYGDDKRKCEEGTAEMMDCLKKEVDDARYKEIGVFVKPPIECQLS